MDRVRGTGHHGGSRGGAPSARGAGIRDATGRWAAEVLELPANREWRGFAAVLVIGIGVAVSVVGFQTRVFGCLL